MDVRRILFNRAQVPTFDEHTLFTALSHPHEDPWYFEDLLIRQLQTLPNVRSGVRVGVLDTGINWLHRSLEDRKIHMHSLRGHTYESGVHGTAVASIIVGNGSCGVHGVAPDAILHSYPVLSSSGMGGMKAVALGIEMARKDGCDVINISLGAPRSDRRVTRQIDKALSDGIVIIAAGGNSGARGGVMHPAKHKYVLSVGATNKEGLVTKFSSTEALGDIDIVAPGDLIRAAANGSQCREVSGTSFAAPIVSGLAALLKQKGIHIDMDTFMRNARDITSVGEDIDSGFGIVDVSFALPRDRPGPQDPILDR